MTSEPNEAEPTPPDDAQEWVTIAEAADLLHTSVPYASLLCNQGNLGEVAEVEGKRQVRKSAVEEYLAWRRQQYPKGPTYRQAALDAGRYDIPEERYVGYRREPGSNDEPRS